MEFEKNGIKIKFDIAPFMEDRDINANENEAAVFCLLCPFVGLYFAFWRVFLRGSIYSPNKKTGHYSPAKKEKK